MRAALSHYWIERGLSRLPLPLSGAASLSAEAPRDTMAWSGEFLRALAAEAADGMHLLRLLERDWHAGRHAVRDRRRGSYAAAAVDILAAAPVLSATTLAASLGIAQKNAGRLLETFTISRNCGRGYPSLEAAPLWPQTLGAAARDDRASGGATANPTRSWSASRDH